MTIIRIKQLKSGVEDYLESGSKKGRKQHRDELDKRSAIYGNLTVFKQANQYVLRKKDWKNSYWHITMSLPFKYHLAPQGVLREMVVEILDFYFTGYDKKQLAAYAEIHYPKIQTNEKGDQRLPHVHLVVSKLDLWSAKQVRGLLYKEEAAEAFQFWIDDNHRFDSHQNSSLTESSVLKIMHKHQQFHLKHKKDDKHKFKPNKSVISKGLKIDESDKQNQRYLNELHDEFLWYQKKQQKIRQENKNYSAIQSLKMRLNNAVACVDSIEEIEQCTKGIDVEDVIEAAAKEFMLNPRWFCIVDIEGKKLALDSRSGQTFNAFGIVHEHLNKDIIDTIKWLKMINKPHLNSFIEYQ